MKHHRVFVRTVVKEPVVAWLNAAGVTGFGVEEIGTVNEGLHWHWYFEIQYASEAALRMEMGRKIEGFKGRAKHSIKFVPDDEKQKMKVFRYMCKGTGSQWETQGPKVVWCHSIIFTEPWRQARHSEYWETNVQIKNDRKTHLIDAVKERCQERSVRWYERRQIAEQFVLELVERKKPINTFALKAQVNLLQVLLGGSNEAIDLLCDQI